MCPKSGVPPARARATRHRDFAVLQASTTKKGAERARVSFAAAAATLRRTWFRHARFGVLTSSPRRASAESSASPSPRLSCSSLMVWTGDVDSGALLASGDPHQCDVGTELRYPGRLETIECLARVSTKRRSAWAIPNHLIGPSKHRRRTLLRRGLGIGALLLPPPPPPPPAPPPRPRRHRDPRSHPGPPPLPWPPPPCSPPPAGPPPRPLAATSWPPPCGPGPPFAVLAWPLPTPLAVLATAFTDS